MHIALLLLWTLKLGQVCPDPAHPCPGFKSNDLSFVTEANGTAKADEKSEWFYAVILRSTVACSITEAQRLSVQTAFSRTKVFSSRFQCDDDVENNVRYENTNDRVAFLAVYGGLTLPAARAFFRESRIAARYPGANVRRMRVVRVWD